MKSVIKNFQYKFCNNLGNYCNEISNISYPKQLANRGVSVTLIEAKSQVAQVRHFFKETATKYFGAF